VNENYNKKGKYIVADIDSMPDADVKRLKSTKAAAKEYIDFDYLDKLSPAEREWHNKFVKEYYHNDIAKVHTLHPKKDFKKLYNNDHARRRELSKYNTPVILSPNYSQPSPEDAIIEAIDLCRKNKK